MSIFIKKKFIGDNEVDGAKVLMLNNQAVRSQNASGASVELFKLDASNVLQFVQMPQVSADPTSANHLARKSYVDAQDAAEAAARAAAVSGLEAAVDAEEARALASEAALQAEIDAEEVARAAAVSAEEAARVAADNALDARLDVVEGGESVVGSIAHAVAAEAALRLSADNALQAAISAESTNRAAEIAEEAATRADADNALAGDIADEVARAEAAEEALDEKIDQEIFDRSQAVSAEEAARIAADAALQTQINNILSNVDPAALDSLTEVVAAFQAADSSLNSAISALGTGSSSAIAVEEAARIAADNALDARLDIVEGGESVVGSIAHAVKAEEDAREAADAALQAEIDAEEAAREAADTALQGEIDAEEAARIAADNALASDLDAEEMARIAADNALQSDIDALEGSRATRALDNLENTSINAALIPSADMQTNLGSGMNRWGMLYVNQVEASDFVSVGELKAKDFMSKIGSMGSPFAEAYSDSFKGKFFEPGMSPTESSLGKEGNRFENAWIKKINSAETVQTSKIEVTTPGLGTSQIGDDAQAFEKAYIGEILPGMFQMMSKVGSSSRAFSEIHGVQITAAALKANNNLGPTQPAQIGEMSNPFQEAFIQTQNVNLIRPSMGVSESSIGTSAQPFALVYSQRAYGSEVPVSPTELTNKQYVDGLADALDTRLDALELDSVTKAYVDSQDAAGLASAEAYTDAAIVALKDGASASYDSLKKIEDKIEFIVENTDPAALDSLAEIVSAFQGADGTINAAISNLASSASANLAAEEAARIAADAAEASARQAADAAEAAARQAADDALDARIDVLEADPTTETYVDAQVASEAAARIAGDAVLQAAIDAVESSLSAFQPAAPEVFTLSSTDIANQYIELTVSAVVANSVEVRVNRMFALPSEFTQSSGTAGKVRLSFAGALATGGQQALVAGDTLVVRYWVE